MTATDDRSAEPTTAQRKCTVKTKGDGSGRHITVAQGRKPRVNVPPDVKKDCLDFLEAVLAATGVVTWANYEFEAARLNVVPEVVYRWFTTRFVRRGETPPGRNKTVGNQEWIVEVRAADGILLTAWQNLTLDGKVTCAYSTFCRVYSYLNNADQAAGRDGSRAALKHNPRQPVQEHAPGERVYCDLYHVPLAVRRRADGKPFAPYLLAMVDGLAWRVMAWATFDHVPTAMDVISTYAKMLLPNTLADGTVIAGSAAQFKPDNGTQLVAHEAVEALGFVRTAIEPTNVESPWEKSKVEVFFQPLENELLKTLPGYVSQARRRNGMPEFNRNEKTLEYKAAVAKIGAWIHMFNTQRIASGQTMPPDARFAATPHVLRHVPEAMVAQLAQAPKLRACDNRGVRIDGRGFHGSYTMSRTTPFYVSQFGGDETDLPVVVAWDGDDEENLTFAELLKPELSGPERVAMVQYVAVGDRSREGMIARARALRAVRETTPLIAADGQADDDGSTSSARSEHPTTDLPLDRVQRQDRVDATLFEPSVAADEPQVPAADAGASGEGADEPGSGDSSTADVPDAARSTGKPTVARRTGKPPVARRIGKLGVARSSTLRSLDGLRPADTTSDAEELS